MIARSIGKVLVSCVLVGWIAGVCKGQEEHGQKKPEASPAIPSGAELYRDHCVTCHGNDLKGTGPFPPPYRVPPDLSTLSRRHGGKFPEAYVFRVLRNGVRLPAHGLAEMPVWGAEFEARNGLDKAQVELRIRNLALYLKSLQAK